MDFVTAVTGHWWWSLADVPTYDIYDLHLL